MGDSNRNSAFVSGSEGRQSREALVYDEPEEPFLEYVETDSEGYFVFEYGDRRRNPRSDGGRVRAKQEGDTLEWSDGTVYYYVGYSEREQLDGEAISGGDAKLAGDAIPGGDAITAKQRKRVKLDGDLDAEAEAISGGDAVLASGGD